MHVSHTIDGPATTGTAREGTHASGGIRRWVGRTAAVVAALTVAAVLYGAYGYQPAEAGRGHTSPYLRAEGSRFADTPLARFHYLRAGSGSPVVLLSPGGASVIGWKEQLGVLARAHTVYVVDLPGQGYTRLKDRRFRWDLPAMTGAIASFMDAVGVRRAALAGNSWSGGWALAFAQRHPDRVSRLALLDATALHVKDTWSWEILKYPVIGELLTNLTGTGKATYRGWIAHTLVHRERATAQLVDELWAPATFRDNLRATYELERGLNWAETEEAMPSTRTPTLVLWGEQDKIVPVWQARRIGALLPDARVQILDRCGHAVQLDCPEPVNRLLLDFLRETA
ncbi:alpha/beta fold hydrolase [Sphaerisporangium fuscum]|uniref:alpha/beta fold hydrolase n=1 Tax=Sphaerisporangium fuscum TaxID=2835868 RepID=UPI001BDC15E3|nr:alpha/beta fold hydrolase [Sphaerisporangium fuscum]